MTFVPSPALYPFRSRRVDLDGLHVNYVDEGQGRPILMCHGNPAWSFLYRKVITRLRDRYRCVAVDLPGFGLSDRPDAYGYTPQEHAAVLATVIDRLELDDVIVMAQDWGGPIGMAAALSRRERVAGLVFMNTFFWPPDESVPRLAVLGAASPPSRWLVRRASFAVPLAIRHGTTCDLTPEELRHYSAVQPTAAARRGVAELPRQLRAARTWFDAMARDAPRAFADRPLLLIWGLRDPLLGRQSVIARWQASFPAARLVALPDANHYIQEDAPDEIASAITATFG